MRRPRLLGLALALLLLAPLARMATAQTPPLDFVVILTDDQRFDSLQEMPLTLAALASRGVTFSRAFVTNPVCAPSRASLLSGGFVSHSTGVVDNVLPNGGVALFDDSSSLATALQGAGYEESIRVPFVIAAPGAPQGTVDERLVTLNLDLPATLLDLAGVSHFGDGTSLVPRGVSPPASFRSVSCSTPRPE